MSVKNIIFSLVLCLVLAGVGIGVYCAWPAITGVITESSYYTSEDLQDSYNKGYDDALKNKTELEGQVEYYKNLTDEYYLSILNYQEQNRNLQSNNDTLQQNISSLRNTISNLQSQITDYQSQIQNLEDIISDNNKKINDFEIQIEQNKSRIEMLNSSYQNKVSEVTNLKNQIESLQEQILGLQSLNSQLETSNQSNLRIISNLNVQISSLNAQIVTLQNQYQGNQDTINALNDKIKQLEKSIEYYEQFIANLENGEKVVATFEFNGAVYNIQILQKGGKVLFPTPDSTSYIIFNYWETESGEKVQDTSSYTISENIKFVANITQKFDVKFSVDGIVRESQIVEKGHKPISPSETPSKAGYVFDGWTLNGVDIVDVTQQSITQNTTFIAKFTQKFTVTFMYESEIKSTQEVRSGEHAQNVEIESTTYKRFNGWKVNGEIVTVEDYEIVGDTVFVADLTYFFEVKYYIEDEQFGNTEYFESGLLTISDVSVPSKSGYKFAGWTTSPVFSSSTLVYTSGMICDFSSDVNLYAIYYREKITIQLYVDSIKVQTVTCTVSLNLGSSNILKFNVSGILPTTVNTPSYKGSVSSWRTKSALTIRTPQDFALKFPQFIDLFFGDGKIDLYAVIPS